MIKRLCLVLLAFMLQGCIPAVFVAGAAAGGSIIYENRDMKTIIKDRDITFQANQRIHANRELKARTNISAICFNHVMLLVGQAPTPELRSKAEKLARVSSNIRVFHNEITIEEPIEKGAEATDSWITTKVKTALLAEKGLNSTQIKIITENGTVYMLGLVTRGQAELATERTRSVEGVQKVVKLFEYIN